MAQQDLDLTNLENQQDEDNCYGNGAVIGKEIDERIRNEEEAARAVKQ